MRNYQFSIKLFVVFFLMAIVLCGCQQKQTEADIPWVSLFDGNTFNGWNQKGGKADYTIRDGTIVGTTVWDTPNSFLTTDSLFDNFILEFEFLVDPAMNSGLQIRSNSVPSYRHGNVYGYQIEIDPSDRAWSGGIYDQSRRGWLCPLTQNPKARKAFKQNQWNHYRIEAIGDTIKTWINTIPAAHLIDDVTNRGFVALQVHEIYEKKNEGAEIIWRNLRILTENISEYTRKSELPPIVTKNTLTAAEIKEGGWKMLWDGQSTKGWKGVHSDTFPSNRWQIKNGALSAQTQNNNKTKRGNDIMTKETFGDFELKLDFKIIQKSKSDIISHTAAELEKTKDIVLGLTYQIDENIHLTANKNEKRRYNDTSASLVEMIILDSKKSVAVVGEWNTVQIKHHKGQIEHWLNGTRVLSQELKSEGLRQTSMQNRDQKRFDFLRIDKGHIVLNNDSGAISFRNIKMKQ